MLQIAGGIVLAFIFIMVLISFMALIAGWINKPKDEVKAKPYQRDVLPVRPVDVAAGVLPVVSLLVVAYYAFA